MLKFTNPYSGREMDVALVRDQYVEGSRLYVGLWAFDAEENFWEPWSEITVNLPGETLTDELCGFVDSNYCNTGGSMPGFLVENGLAAPTGKVAFSGFCTYQEFRFNIEKIDEHLLVIAR